MKFRPKIAQHDYDVKKGRVERFLKAKNKVKITIMFRGREVTHPERGRAILERLAEELAEVGVIEQHPAQDGRNMTMMLGPSKAALAGRADHHEDHDDHDVSPGGQAPDASVVAPDGASTSPADAPEAGDGAAVSDAPAADDMADDSAEPASAEAAPSAAGGEAAPAEPPAPDEPTSATPAAAEA